MRIPIMAASVIAWCVFASPAVAQQNCASAAGLQDELAKRFGEAPASAGEVNGGGAAVVVMANRETGSFTVLALMPNGVGCVLASGQGWHDVTPKPPVGKAS